MKQWLRFLSLVVAAWTGLIFIHLRGRGYYLMVAKMVATAVSPFLFLIGGLLGLIGLWRRDGVTAVFGSLSALGAGRYITAVAAPHDQFAQTFGSHWQDRLPEAWQKTFLTDRYTFPLPPARECPWQRDVVIGVQAHTQDPLLADIWQPPTDAPRSGLAVIYLHGSAWRYLDKDIGTRYFFRQLARRGHVVVDVAYTLAPKANYLGSIADVKRAIVWTRAHAAELGIDPAKIVLMGGSAGGHLALLAAFAPNHATLEPADVMGQDTAVAGVISFYGIGDLARAHLAVSTIPDITIARDKIDALLLRYRLMPPYGKRTSNQEMISGWMGCTPDECPDLYRLASPIHHAGPHCPPTLLLNGVHDLPLDVGHHRQIAAALRHAAVPVIHVEYPWTEHGFDLFFPRFAPPAQAALYEIERFLALLAAEEIRD
jgi:acetyl esterase/lipase